MSLGFYSEVARRHVVKTREFITARGYASTPDDIRRFRQDLAVRNARPELRWLCDMPDFYSTSECRDLLFHVQEHRLTLGQIESSWPVPDSTSSASSWMPACYVSTVHALPTTQPPPICATGHDLRPIIRTLFPECTNSGFKSRSDTEVQAAGVPASGQLQGRLWLPAHQRVAWGRGNFFLYRIRLHQDFLFWTSLMLPG